MTAVRAELGSLSSDIGLCLQWLQCVSSAGATLSLLHGPQSPTLQTLLQDGITLALDSPLRSRFLIKKDWRVGGSYCSVNIIIIIIIKNTQRFQSGKERRMGMQGVKLHIYFFFNFLTFYLSKSSPCTYPKARRSIFDY